MKRNVFFEKNRPGHLVRRAAAFYGRRSRASGAGPTPARIPRRPAGLAGTTAETAFGSVDAMKLPSSLALLVEAGGDALFGAAEADPAR
ncbi:MAG TPA: hypothetical protein VFG14_11300 [Chthoniobacteraceae bacterium]|nr:hypothetical protein [Chthoniobacteraceae bacterium]